MAEYLSHSNPSPEDTGSVFKAAANRPGARGAENSDSKPIHAALSDSKNDEPKQDETCSGARKVQTAPAVAHSGTIQGDAVHEQWTVDVLAQEVIKAMNPPDKDALVQILQFLDRNPGETPFRELCHHEPRAAVKYFFIAVLAGLMRDAAAFSDAELAEVSEGKYFNVPLKGPDPIRKAVKRIASALRRQRRKKNRALPAQADTD